MSNSSPTRDTYRLIPQRFETTSQYMLFDDHYRHHLHTYMTPTLPDGSQYST